MPHSERKDGGVGRRLLSARVRQRGSAGSSDELAAIRENVSRRPFLSIGTS
jgi:hypothetical protein